MKKKIANDKRHHITAEYKNTHTELCSLQSSETGAMHRYAYLHLHYGTAYDGSIHFATFATQNTYIL